MKKAIQVRNGQLGFLKRVAVGRPTMSKAHLNGKLLLAGDPYVVVDSAPLVVDNRGPFVRVLVREGLLYVREQRLLGTEAGG